MLLVQSAVPGAADRRPIATVLPAIMPPFIPRCRVWALSAIENGALTVADIRYGLPATRALLLVLRHKRMIHQASFRAQVGCAWALHHLNESEH
jgi:hypothetical protein